MDKNVHLALYLASALPYLTLPYLTLPSAEDFYAVQWVSWLMLKLLFCVMYFEAEQIKQFFRLGKLWHVQLDKQTVRLGNCLTWPAFILSNQKCDLPFLYLMQLLHLVILIPTVRYNQCQEFFFFFFYKKPIPVYYIVH